MRAQILVEFLLCLVAFTLLFGVLSLFIPGKEKGNQWFSDFEKSRLERIRQSFGGDGIGI